MVRVDPSEAAYEERRQQEAEHEMLAGEARERRIEKMPVAPLVLKTPREQVDAYLRSATECLSQGDTQAALRWLDEARAVVQSPNVVDGAQRLERLLYGLRDAAEEGELDRVVSVAGQAIEVLQSEVRTMPGVLPVDASDFAPQVGDVAREHGEKRLAVRAVLKRRQFELTGRLDAFSDELLEEIVAAAETGI